MKLKTTHYQDILQKFDTHVVSTKSIKCGNHYHTHVKDFLLFLESKDILNLNKVSAPIMREYFNYLTQRPKKHGSGTLSPSSINDNLSTLRCFSIRMQKEKVIQNALAVPNNIKIEQELKYGFALSREILTVDEVKTVFNDCESDLEKSLIALAYGCGLRRGTLETLIETQINFQEGTVTPTRMKNNKTLEVPISDFFLEVLKEYSMQRLQILASKDLRTKHFFIDGSGKMLNGDHLNEMLKRIIQRTNDNNIKAKKITLHCLRHSIATHLIDAGETFQYVKAFLGHAFIDTSTIYAKRRKIKDLYQI